MPITCARAADAAFRGSGPWGDGLLPLAEVEARFLSWAASQAPDRARLAQALGLSERTLYRKLGRSRREG